MKEISAIFRRELQHYKKQLLKIKELQLRDLITIKGKEKRIQELEKVICDARNDGAPPHPNNLRRAQRKPEMTRDEFMSEIRQMLMHLSDLDVNDLMTDREFRRKIGVPYRELQWKNEQLRRELDAA